jgi:hypothetical protein
MTYWKSKVGLMMILLTVLLLSGCLGGRYGNIYPDGQVSKDFDSFKIDPGVNYYYSGPDLYPNALIGLKKEYVLDSDLWKSFKPTPESFRDMILHMQDKAQEYREFQRGFIMYDNKGQPIGVWYSILKARTFTQMGEGNKVRVYTPDLMIYMTGPGGPSTEVDRR